MKRNFRIRKNVTDIFSQGDFFLFNEKPQLGITLPGMKYMIKLQRNCFITINHLYFNLVGLEGVG